jgi:hypothetical protein
MRSTPARQPQLIGIRWRISKMKDADRPTEEYDLPFMCSFHALYAEKIQTRKARKYEHFLSPSLWKGFLRCCCLTGIFLSSIAISLLTWYCSSHPILETTLRGCVSIHNIRLLVHKWQYSWICEVWSQIRVTMSHCCPAQRSGWNQVERYKL